jgi:hypothetical protein
MLLMHCLNDTEMVVVVVVIIIIIIIIIIYRLYAGHIQL